MRKIKLINDIRNYFFYQRTIKKNKKGTEFKKFNLRTDWINRIYTVVEVKEIQDGSEFSNFEHVALVLESLIPINNYLVTLNLSEIITPDVKKIEGTDSWLVVYSYKWNFWNWKKLLLLISLIILSLVVKNNYSHLIEYFNNF